MEFFETFHTFLRRAELLANLQHTEHGLKETQAIWGHLVWNSWVWLARAVMMHSNKIRGLNDTHEIVRSQGGGGGIAPGVMLCFLMATQGVTSKTRKITT